VVLLLIKAKVSSLAERFGPDMAMQRHTLHNKSKISTRRHYRATIILTYQMLAELVPGYVIK
jgi:hypothetical protein